MTLNYIKKLIGIIIGVAAQGYGYLAVYHRSYDAELGLYIDGLGRVLKPVPLAVYWVQDSLWPGLLSFGIDWVIFVALMIIAISLFESAE
jgi:hypothetical protein|tara:strand:- start:278 stop:547 length:270 start_codon:yes stop_codon:yes gene_type:complete